MNAKRRQPSPTARLHFTTGFGPTGYRKKQGVALTGRNTTGPPSVLPPGELRCICECYRRRRQTPAIITSLAPYVMCRWASNNVYVHDATVKLVDRSVIQPVVPCERGVTQFSSSTRFVHVTGDCHTTDRVFHLAWQAVESCRLSIVFSKCRSVDKLVRQQGWTSNSTQQVILEIESFAHFISRPAGKETLGAMFFFRCVDNWPARCAEVYYYKYDTIRCGRFTCAQ